MTLDIGWGPWSRQAFGRFNGSSAKPIQRRNCAKRGNPYGVSGRVNIINAGHALTARENRNGNDGTIARFGWKAQNKSLLAFAGEAYNVEMGISNELFQTEREEDPSANSSLRQMTRRIPIRPAWMC
jgi:CxxC motif-containing protein (DUF1111 family)